MYYCTFLQKGKVLYDANHYKCLFPINGKKALKGYFAPQFMAET